VSEFLLPLLQRWVLFAGVLLLVGLSAWRAVVAPRATTALGRPHTSGRLSEIADADSFTGFLARGARIGRNAAVLLIPVWALRIQVQLLGFRDPFVPLSEDLSFLVRETFWGTVWLAQGLLLLLAAAWFHLLAVRHAGAHRAGANQPRARIGSSTEPIRWAIAACGVLLLTMTLPLSSHAMAGDARLLALLADSAHTLAAGAWIGTLVIVLALSRGEGGGALLAAQLRAFSPLAMTAVTVLVGAGILLSVRNLGAPSDLWATSYGRVLSGKVLAAATVLFLGFLNWKRGLPVLDSPAGRAAVCRRALLETAAAAVVLLVTAILTGMTPPGID